MAFNKNYGVLGVATSYDSSTDKYSYSKIDQFVAADNLTITPQRAQDLDSYRNANGYLKRHVLKHTASGITFTTPYMDNPKMQEFLKLFRDCMKLHGCETFPEKKVRIRYYDTWIDDYSKGFFYFPDTSFQPGGTYKGYPVYLPNTFELIEY